MNDAVNHLATSTRHAAATTAHTLSSLAGEAQHKLDDLDLPDIGRPKRRSRRGWWLALVLLGAIAAIAAKRKSDADSTPPADTRQATDSAPTTAMREPLTAPLG